MAAQPGRLTLCVVQVFLALLSSDIVYSLQEYAFSPFCSFSSVTNVDLQYESSAFVTFSRENYMSYMDCKMHVSVKPGHQIAVRFVKFDIPCSDSLRLYDGDNAFSTSLGSYCGSTLFDDIQTSGSELVIQLNTDFFSNGDGFKLLITSFKTGYCETSNNQEFKCKNGRCIDFDLYCNDEDNCGDKSDYCYKDYNWWIWVIVGIVVFVIICVIITVICCCCCKRSKPGTIVIPNPGVAVHYNAGMHTAGTTISTTTPGANPWYGSPTSPPQYQPQNAYPPAYPPTYPPPHGQPPPPPYSAPPPSYTSVYPANQQVNPNWPATDPVPATDKSAL